MSKPETGFGPAHKLGRTDQGFATEHFPPPSGVVTGTPALTQLQRRRSRLLAGVTLYIVGLYTGFLIGTER